MSAARLSRLVEQLAARRDVTHAVAAAESVDGSFRWTAATGEAGLDGTPMQPGTPFFIASIDKLYNATIALKLYEQGLLDLDAPLTACLPVAAIGGLHRLGGVDYTDRITVRHLLSHTSGLPDWLEDYPKGAPSLVEQVVETGDRMVWMEELIELVRDRLTPHFPPQPLGTGRVKARYSDTNFMLLCAIVERVAGRPLHVLHEEMLRRPLDLRATWIEGHHQPLAPAPKPAVLWAGDRPLEIPLLMKSFRGIYSTASDMIRVLRALVRGRLFERPETLELMQRDWQRFGLPLDRAALRAPGWPIQYGLGTMRFQPPRIFSPFRPAPALVGHTGSTGAWLFHCPERHLLLAGTLDQVTAGAVPFRFVPKLIRELGTGG